MPKEFKHYIALKKEVEENRTRIERLEKIVMMLNDRLEHMEKVAVVISDN